MADNERDAEREFWDRVGYEERIEGSSDGVLLTPIPPWLAFLVVGTSLVPPIAILVALAGGPFSGAFFVAVAAGFANQLATVYALLRGMCLLRVSSYLTGFLGFHLNCLRVVGRVLKR